MERVKTMETAKPFQTFEDLETYQAARAFRKSMYAVARKPFNLFNPFNSL